jgi:hypothetical protein
VIAATLVATAVLTAAPATGDATAYLVNVTVRPGYHFADAQQALAYGYGICGRVEAGVGYPDLVAAIQRDYSTNDHFHAGYLISQAVNELCPAQIWALRRSAAGTGPWP